MLVSNFNTVFENLGISNTVDMSICDKIHELGLYLISKLTVLLHVLKQEMPKCSCTMPMPSVEI